MEINHFLFSHFVSLKKAENWISRVSFLSLTLSSRSISSQPSFSFHHHRPLPPSRPPPPPSLLCSDDFWENFKHFPQTARSLLGTLIAPSFVFWENFKHFQMARSPSRQRIVAIGAFYVSYVTIRWWMLCTYHLRRSIESMSLRTKYLMSYHNRRENLVRMVYQSDVTSVVNIRVSGAYSVTPFGERLPRSGTPPPTLRGPESVRENGGGSTRAVREKGGGPHISSQSNHFLWFFFFLNKKIRGVKRGVAPSNGGVRGV
ncbi:hypothetical protein HanIR_Chr04g0201441 [Helianthus annuus]|nr:hypothetical protein HanIR_Chr04g0201441 [Helianthus annuus]